MSRANSLKKAVRQIIEHAEKGKRREKRETLSELFFLRYYLAIDFILNCIVWRLPFSG